MLENQGNDFRPLPPEASTCHGESQYTFDLETGALTWVSCKIGNFSDPWLRETGSRVLSDAERAQLVAALTGVTLAQGEEPCGADKPTLALSVSDGRSERLYVDSFYICYDPGRSYVNDIDGAFSVASDLTES